jgi:hypothetical protein
MSYKNILFTTFCLISFSNPAFGDVRNQSFSKSEKIKQFIAAGGNYQSDQNSRKRAIALAYRYKSKKFVHEFEFLNRSEYTDVSQKSTGKKVLIQTEDLYDAELSSKRMIGSSNNYFNYYNRSKYDEYSDYYYDLTNVAGVGRRFEDGKIEADINIGYNQVKNYNSEMVINPTLRIKLDITKDLILISKGYLFQRENSYTEQLKSRLSYRMRDERIFLELINNYEKNRYFSGKNGVTNNINRSIIFRIRYDF